MTTVAILGGDQTGQELLDEALRVLDATRLTIDRQYFDLSLTNRRDTGNRIVYEASRALRRCGFGLKAATITPEGQDDVGSPNAILRREIDGTVILRTGHRIPGVPTVGGANAPISVVRMAIDDAYGATEWREGSAGDERAYRTESIRRSVCRGVAEYAFLHATRTGSTVFGGPKYTVSPVYEGLLKEEMDAAAARYPDVRYAPQLIDTTYALLVSGNGEPLVIPALNRDGDCLSDLVLQLFGSLAGSESLLLSFDDRFAPRTVMAEAPHGTAPSLEGQDIANPMAMILALASLLSHVQDAECQDASRAIYDAVFRVVEDGTRTRDLGGTAGTRQFTDAVIERTVQSTHRP